MLIRSRARFSPPWGDPRRWLAALLSLLLLAGAFDVGAAVDGSVRAVVSQEAGLEPSGDDLVPLGRLEVEARTGGPARSVSTDDDRPPPTVALAASWQDDYYSARTLAVVGNAPGALPRIGAPSSGHRVRAPPA